MTENPYSQMVLDGTAMLDCKWLGLKHQVYGNGSNLMERFYLYNI